MTAIAAAIAGTLIDRVSADPTLGRSFKDAQLDRIKKLLAELICAAWPE